MPHPVRKVRQWFRNPRGLKPHAWFITRVQRPFLLFFAKFKLVNARSYGKENIPRKGRVIVVCNHISISDPLFLWGAMPRNAVAIAAAGLWKVILFGFYMRIMGHIPIRRGQADSRMAVLEAATNVLEHNGLIMMYPEGGIPKLEEREGQTGFWMRDFKFGMGYLAFETMSPVVPGIIVGSDKFKPTGKWWKFGLRARVRQYFDKPIDPADYLFEGGKEQFVADVRAAMFALHERHYPSQKAA